MGIWVGLRHNLDVLENYLLDFRPPPLSIANCANLGCYSASGDNSLPTFRYKLIGVIFNKLPLLAAY